VQGDTTELSCNEHLEPGTMSCTFWDLHSLKIFGINHGKLFIE